MVEFNSGQGLTRDEFLRWGGAGLLGATALGGLIGCGQNASSDKAAGGGTAKETLVLAVPALMSSLDREFEIGAGSIEAMINVYDPLTMWPKVPFSNNSFVPDLGNTDSWKLNLIEEAAVAKDGVTWTIRFKSGVMSHAGNEMTAEDYLYCLERHAELWALGSFYNFVAGFLPRRRKDMFKVVDKLTLQAVTQKPSPVYMALLENNLAEGLFDATEAKKHKTASDPWSTKWMKTNGGEAGHGPYVIESHTPGSQTVFRAFDGYHGGAPAIKSVVHRAIESSSTRASLLTAGQVDLVRDLLPADFKKLEKTPGVVVDDFDKAKFLLLFMMMNCTKPPFNDVKVRQALAYATPYDRIVQNAYQGYADRWNGIISRDYPYFSDAGWPYGDGENFSKAKDLLKQAGYPNGFNASCIYNASEVQPELVAIELQTAFKEIGVNLKLQKFAAAAFTENLSTQKFDTAVWLDLALTPDIGYACYLFYRSSAFSNMGKFSDPKADAYVDEILTTLDPGKRETVAKEFQAYILQQSPHLYLAQPHYVLARRENVQGVTAYTSRALRFDDVKKV
jgi:peptide/nickel transport system substrate-binding protein